MRVLPDTQMTKASKEAGRCGGQNVSRKKPYSIGLYDGVDAAERQIPPIAPAVDLYIATLRKWQKESFEVARSCIRRPRWL